MGRDIPQGPMVVHKGAGVQHLNAGVVLSVEGSRCGGTACREGNGGRGKPEAEMIHLDWIEWRGQAGIRKRSGEDNRRWRRTDRHGERLNTEASAKLPTASTAFVGRDVAQIPRDTKGSLGDLDDKESELRVGTQPLDRDVHRLNGPPGRDLHRGARLRLSPSRTGQGIVPG